MTPRPGVTVFTQPVNGNVTIYVVGTDGELHPFATPTQFLQDGYNGANVITVPNQGGLTVGSNAGKTLTALVTKADGAIVNSSGTLYTFAGGRAFGIPTPAALRDRKSNSAVELQGSVPPADTGAPIADGVVLSVAGPVYVSYVGKGYPFKTTAQLANTGTAAPRLSRRLTPAGSLSFSPTRRPVTFGRTIHLLAGEHTTSSLRGRPPGVHGCSRGNPRSKRGFQVAGRVKDLPAQRSQPTTVSGSEAGLQPARGARGDRAKGGWRLQCHSG